MDSDLTNEELLAALLSCSDSAPGSDGIPNSVYKKLWATVGRYMCLCSLTLVVRLDSWMGLSIPKEILL